MAGDAAAHRPSGPPSTGDFVLRHRRSSGALLASTDHSSRRNRPAARPGSPELARAVPNGGGDFDESTRSSRVDDGRPVGYISLRDLLDSPPTPPPPQDDWARSPTTPTPGGGGGPGEIRIRNRLVKQAAYAYLQPTPSAAESDRSRRRRALRRALAVVTCGLAAEPLLGCIDFIRHLFRWPRRRRLF